jgi:fucose 4-O-acetylase-like acetyltransferase
MRNIDIDVAKGLGILAVALGHNQIVSGSENQETHRFIYLFHMPLFFILSGAFFFKPLGTRALATRVRSLLWPFAFSFFIFLPRQLYFPNHPSNDSIVTGFIWGSGNMLYNTPAWFLLALCISLIAANAIIYITANHARESASFAQVCIGLILCLIGYALIEYFPEAFQYFRDRIGRPIGLPFNIDLLLVSTGYVLLGAAVTPTFEWLQEIGTRKTTIMLLIASMITYLAFKSGPRVDLNYRYVTSWPAAVISAASMVLVTFCAAHLIKSTSIKASNILSFLGQHTLLILIFHSAIQAAIIKRIPSDSSISLLAGIVTSISVCYLLAVIDLRLILRSKHTTFAIYGR